MTNVSAQSGNDADGGAVDQKQRYDLGDRTARFGEAIVRWARKVKLDAVTRPLVGQMVKAGTSVGANYCEADEAGSKKEFLYRISVCNRETREVMYWLRIVAAASPANRDEGRCLWKEARELNLIFSCIHRKGKARS